MNEYFGEVKWSREDLENALEVQGYPVTENNIEKLYSLCNSHWFTDYMIETGWQYMYDNIGNGDGWDESYYDVVASICTEACRTDSHLICGGFNTEEEAIDYINKHNVSEADYYKYCNDNETAYIEIEERHVVDGRVMNVITVD